MNIIACVKQVVDLQQVRIKQDTKEPVLENIPFTIGNIDKNALEEGIRLRDVNGGKVTVVSAGSEDLEETIKEGLAMGADDAVLVIDPRLENAESATAAVVLAKAIRNIGEFDLILLGEGSTDNYSGQIGPRLSEALDLPLVTYVKSLQVDGNRVRLVRNLDDCFEVVEADLPLIVTVTSEINEARIPAITQILKAGRKPKQILSLDELGFNVAEFEPKISTLSNLAPEQQRKQVVFTDDMDAAVSNVINILRNEGLIGR